MMGRSNESLAYTDSQEIDFTSAKTPSVPTMMVGDMGEKKNSSAFPLALDISKYVPNVVANTDNTIASPATRHCLRVRTMSRIRWPSMK